MSRTALATMSRSAAVASSWACCESCWALLSSFHAASIAERPPAAASRPATYRVERLAQVVGDGFGQTQFWIVTGDLLDQGRGGSDVGNNPVASCSQFGDDVRGYLGGQCGNGWVVLDGLLILHVVT